MKFEINDSIVVVGHAVRLPGGINSVADFERLLFAGRSAIDEMPAERFDRALYYDAQRGLAGKAYTELGGCVSSEPLDAMVEDRISELGTFDLTHRQFAQVAVRAWEEGLARVSGLAGRSGVYVGHSGGTDQGGPLAMARLAELAVDHLRGIESFQSFGESVAVGVMSSVVKRIQQNRPRTADRSVHFDAYNAASLVSRLLSLAGPREVIDAACASSLIGLAHAVMAIRNGRIDAAIVGGATYNNVDNLILFSQSQACSDQGSCPFDRRAGGLISSEGYAAVAITRRSIAEANGLPILCEILSVGVASDGKGKSLWAPRTEGQQLAIRRAYHEEPVLSIDYLEAHATSTQVGDATEIKSLTELRSEGKQPLLVGSVKSNLGHTLEAAGVVGLIKLIIAMRRGEIPPTIHFREPSQEVDAASESVQVVSRVTPWPTRGRSKRGAVNAFGIGGLNGHAVIEVGAASLSVANGRSKGSDEPIVIVGRGVVLPGAFGVKQFAALLSGDATALCHAPKERWRGALGVGPMSSPHFVPTCVGGFIRGYQFDGQPYRIPPKQVRMANPVQMMLIDAVAQAAQEADGGKWAMDRSRTSVIVGTIFGGEFSNQLQIGLRLPELCVLITEELGRAGVSAGDATKIAKLYRDAMLQHYPALLDETGSFTASTLASRIAKSFDLMGGACAIDCDDASGALALMLAADQLRSGEADTVICGVAQRSLDLVAFKSLQLKGELLESGRGEDVPADCSRVLPGEGVAVLMLRRLSAAQQAGSPVYGLIDGFETGVKAKATAFKRSHMAEDAINQTIARRVGYLPGAHSVVRLIAETIRWESSTPVSTRISGTTDDGFFVTAAVRSPKAACTSALSKYTDRPQSYAPVSKPVKTLRADTPTSMNSPTNQSPLIIRFEGMDESHFAKALRTAAESPDSAYVTALTSGSRFSNHSRFRGGIVARSPESVSESVAALEKAWSAGRRSGVFDREQAVMWDRGLGNDRVVWAFPGQGSQYAAVPQVFTEDSEAKGFLSRFDALLGSMGIAPVTQRLGDAESQLGRDVWWTQLWVLAVSAMLADSLGRRGLVPDIVCGHSFGECGAAVQAGIMSMPQAVRFAKLRSDAVVMTVRSRGQLLSVRGAPSRVDSVLSTLGLNLCITHHNAPEQTVIAGKEDEISIAKAAFAKAAMASVVIPVPAAFHSPALNDAQQALRNAFGNERLRPPHTGYFSMMQGVYIAEANQIRDSLIDQLTKPLLYCSGVERLVQDGCGLIVDVGPSDMLNRLHRSIVGDKALCVSLDGANHSHHARLALISLATSCVAAETASHASRLQGNVVFGATPELTPPTIPNGDTESLAAASSIDSLEIVDVTRRQRNKAQVSTPKSAVSATSHSLVSPAERNGAHVIEVVVPPQTAKSHATESSLIERFLVDLVVELTGYSPEVIDFEADLEAELGIDSIKKAQLIGELAEWASLELDLRQMKLSQFATLGNIRDLAAGMEPTRHEAVWNEASAKQVIHETAPVKALPLGVALASPSVECISREQIESLMIDFVVDQTGYSPDVVDVEADLEGELGLDSIKKAQLLGELVSHYDLSSVDLRQVRLASFPTLASIRDFVLASGPQSVASESLTKGNDSDEVMHPHARTVAGVQTEQEDASAKKKSIRLALRTLVDDPSVSSRDSFRALFDSESWDVIRSEGMRGSRIASLANECGVAVESLWAWIDKDGSVQEEEESRRERSIPARGTLRFGLELTRQPRRDGMPCKIAWQGNAVILGNNAIAQSIQARFERDGFSATVIGSDVSPGNAKELLERVWQAGETPHLFLTTPHDEAAVDCLSTTQWRLRRDVALMTPFSVCQHWLQRMIDRGLMAQATLVSVLNAGGDFGFSAARLLACESGGLAGLTKAMLIESWMRGYRETPMKVVDIAPSTSVKDAIDGILRELAVPSHDEEVSVAGDQRWAVRPRYLPLDPDVDRVARRITRGGTWVVSGGGRGITALTSMALAEKYELVLHLLGTAPCPELDATTRERAKSDRPSLRREVMAYAQSVNQNPVELWRDTEKAIEIDQTLTACKQRGIEAHYHSVDVSNPETLRAVLSEIRRQSGPIAGVIHGAGAGQDARFDRKRLDKVEKCIRAKVDGAFALIEATQDDPLEWFVGFGSISGRFGANGHTDYSLANDMLAKVIGQLRRQRPDVAAVTFHWHAWGDIGMATKPEAKLALEMIGMQFMPAEEGLAHFMNEMEFGGDMSEVLITDRDYIRKFFPGFGEESDGRTLLPLLDPTGCKMEVAPSGLTDAKRPWVVTLDPSTDRFLSEHTVGGMPTLPFVIAMEMLAEAATHAASGKRVNCCTNVEAIKPIKFSSNDAMAVEVVPGDSKGDNRWYLQADLRRRDGRVVESGVVRFCGNFVRDDSVEMPSRIAISTLRSGLTFHPIEYLPSDGPVYHGESLQCLRSIAYDGEQEDVAVGKIMTPSPVQLGGLQRPVQGWVFPCAVMDAMLYASAMVAYRRCGQGSLPVRFEQIVVGRLPDPGEPLTVVVRFISSDKEGAKLEADLLGLNDEHLLALRGYHVHWLR